jgi:hypothetical protein
MSQPIDIADARETFAEGTVLQWTVWCGQHLDALLAKLEAARVEIAALRGALLAWKPGPPTEYGLHLVRASFGGKIVTDSQYVCAGDYIKDILFHFGPLPEPPKAEVTNG